MADPIRVIVLNWNGQAFLSACLDSVQAQTYPAVAITVVDNASTDGSVEFLAEHYPDVEILRNAKNLGFAGGNNAGIRSCREKFLVILNNDTDLHPDCLKEMKAVLDAHPEAGACASSIRLKFEESRLDAAGIEICPDGLALGRGRMHPPEEYAREEEVFFASDCCTLYRKAMLDDIGIYDEDFFAYADETDLGWRARSRGWTCRYAPRAVVNHHHSGTGGSHSPFKAYLVERNRLCVLIKNFPPSLMAYGMAYSLARYAWQAYGALARKGRAGAFTRDYSALQLVIILLKAYAGALRLLPRMLAKRRRIRARSVLETRDYWELVRRFGISAREVALRD